MNTTIHEDAPAQGDSIDDILSDIEHVEGEAPVIEQLGAMTVIGHEGHGFSDTVHNLLNSLTPGQWEKVRSGCPFRPNRLNRKGEGLSVTVNEDRSQLTCICWDSSHNHEVTKTTADGREYAVWTYRPESSQDRMHNALRRGDDVEIAARVARLLRTFGPLGWDGEHIRVYDEGKQNTRKTISPTFGTWKKYTDTEVLAHIRTFAGAPVVTGRNRDGTPRLSPLKLSNGKMMGILAEVKEVCKAEEQKTVNRMVRNGEVNFETPTRFQAGVQGIHLVNGRILRPDGSISVRPESRWMVPSEMTIGVSPENRDKSLDAEWEALLCQWLPEEECRRALQLFLGACLGGQAALKCQKHVILLGPGGTGKSTLIEALASIFPSMSKSALSLDEVAKRFQAATLSRKLINVSTETDSEIPVSKLKAILTADFIQVERKHKDPVVDRIVAGHLVAANKLPHGERSNALFRRFIVIPVRGKLTAKDHNINDKIAKMRPSIIQWAIDGLKEIAALEWKLPIPKVSQAEAEAWREDSNPILGFFRHELEAGGSTRSSDLYRAYRSWADDQGITKKVTQRRFGQEMAAAGHEKVRKSDGYHYSVSLKFQGGTTDLPDISDLGV
jgi:P4 family phage/plasmid primase-like protien